jgi:hypothetical protein
LEDVLWPKMIWPVTCPLKIIILFYCQEGKYKPKPLSLKGQASKLFGIH